MCLVRFLCGYICLSLKDKESLVFSQAQSSVLCPYIFSPIDNCDLGCFLIAVSHIKDTAGHAKDALGAKYDKNKAELKDKVTSGTSPELQVPPLPPSSL